MTDTKSPLHQISALADAMSQLLDDMGPNGLCVCAVAKAQARIAFEPFRQPDDDPVHYMELADAARILAEH